MTFLQSSFVSAADGTTIATYEWLEVDGEPRGAVQIAHGLGEHAVRYDRFAAALNDAGFLAFASDHRGHGRTADGNLGDFGAAGFPGLVADVAQYGAIISANHPGVPLFLLGHSMGSFASQSVMIDHGDVYAGVILSGSAALDGLAEALAQSAEGPGGLEAFNVGFEHRTGFEWLSRDEAEVDLYVADAWCGFDTSDETTASLFFDIERLVDPSVLGTIRHDLPVLVASGSADPLAGGGQLVQLLTQRYIDAGLADVTLALYPEARHEILNELNRDDVTHDLIEWLQGRASD